MAIKDNDKFITESYSVAQEKVITSLITDMLSARNGRGWSTTPSSIAITEAIKSGTITDILKAIVNDGSGNQRVDYSIAPSASNLESGNIIYRNTINEIRQSVNDIKNNTPEMAFGDEFVILEVSA